MTSLSGKIAIITGATSGIGERIAERFVQAGARVVATGRRAAEGEALAARCGENLLFHQADVSQEEQVKSLVAHTLERFGQIDCLVNNAGIGSPMVGVADLTEEHFTSVFRTNVLGVILGMKHVAPHMVARRSGSIITVGSMSGIRAGTSGHIYSASKAAVIHLTRSVAGEISRHGVRVNTISPGGIVTGIFAKNAGLSGDKADQLLEAIADLFVPVQPIPRAGATDDIAEAAIYLASDASGFVTGHDLTVDGGFVSSGTLGWDAALEFRAEIGRRVRAITQSG